MHCCGRPLGSAPPERASGTGTGCDIERVARGPAARSGPARSGPARSVQLDGSQRIPRTPIVPRKPSLRLCRVAVLDYWAPSPLRSWPVYVIAALLIFEGWGHRWFHVHGFVDLTVFACEGSPLQLRCWCVPTSNPLQRCSVAYLCSKHTGYGASEFPTSPAGFRSSWTSSPRWHVWRGSRGSSRR